MIKKIDEVRKKAIKIIEIKKHKEDDINKQKLIEQLKEEE